MPPPAPAPGPLALLAACFLAATGVKLLLVPGYRSTDFEVHRNWLALTHALPLKEWYFEATSEWTLDYPPFFAFFERALAGVAVALGVWRHDPALLAISAEPPHASPATVWFQRLSVMATDALLLGGAWANAAPPGLLHCGAKGNAKGSSDGGGGGGKGCRYSSKVALLAALSVGSAGLLVVDHMHFQYNGGLLGLLLLAVAAIRRGHPLLGAAAFATLLMAKHLFLSLAPAFFVLLLRAHCFSSSDPTPSIGAFRPLNFLALGLTVLAVFGLALGPFVVGVGGKEAALAQLQQIASRLFPFGRGLVHAYWAPNAYALYCAADLILGRLLRRLRFLPPRRPPGQAGWASGLVQVVEPEALPRVTPLATALLTLAGMAPALWQLWRQGARKGATTTLFPLALLHCGLSAFILGWHVHEKAVLVPALLSAVLAPQDPRYAHLAFWLCAIGHAGLLPLFPPATADALTAYALIQAGTLLTWLAIERAHPRGTGGTVAALPWPWAERLYFAGLQAVLLLALAFHPWLLAARFPFLARLAVSVYCAVGLVAVWLRSCQLVLAWEGEGEGEEEKPAAAKGKGKGKKKGATAAVPKTSAAAAAAAETAEPPVESTAKAGNVKGKKKAAAAKAGKAAAPAPSSSAAAAAAAAAAEKKEDGGGAQRRSRRLRGKAGSK